jgi:acyl-CoA:acyl-CoA alkyltransferase
MIYRSVHLDSFGYELAPVVVTSTELEARVAPLYQKLRIAPGQLEALTGIVERRWWPEHYPLSEGAAAAAKKALAKSHIQPGQIQALIYAGVCRENFEPATACAVAAQLGAGGGGIAPNAFVYDISNACLGVLNGIIDLANRIELGQITAGMVVSCESAREINDLMIRKMLAHPTMPMFTHSLATLTGGSGAVAVILTHRSLAQNGAPRLLGGVAHSAPEHHKLCRWGATSADDPSPFMSTDSVAVLKNGVELGARTWKDLLTTLDWTPHLIDKVICHQVGHGHRNTILKQINVPVEKDFSTYSYLGNIGTVSLPLTAALAQQRGFLKPGDRVAFLGIGSGLNCLMLGWEW